MILNKSIMLIFVPILYKIINTLRAREHVFDVIEWNLGNLGDIHSRT